MGAITYDMEITSSIPAGKLFKAFVLDSDNLIPKIMPQAIKSVEILEGDGGVGTIKIITFGEGSQFKSIKHRVDNIDKENLTYSYSIIEGDALNDVLESINYHIKIVPTADGGSICKNRSIYNTKGDVQITEEKIKEGKEKATGMFKAVEAYLQANPDAYN
ncbi:MLP-like protein [Abeliophyllum distichum]|uniref:MLP-like protein n=1 Tax=Abeliophyllum distichum TaxID=126358 RepID=A0ABD1NPC1_9LAMI